MRITYQKSRHRFGRVTAIISLAAVSSMLVVGSAGSILQVATARESDRNGRGYYSSHDRRSRDNSNNRSESSNMNRQSSNRSQDQKQTQTPQRQQPKQAEQAPAAPVAPETPPPSSPAPQTVVTPAVTPPEPVDTAPQIAQMTSAQADDTAATVSYASSRISSELRDRLIIAAVMAALAGGALYTMSVLMAGAKTQRTIPVRYTIPVQEP